MKIALVCNAQLPAKTYGGTERVVWDLANALAALGHRVVLAAAKGTVAPFAQVVELNPDRPVADILPGDVDVVHFNNIPDNRNLTKPYIVAVHGNNAPGFILDKNSVFVSSDHAARYGSREFVYNGLNWDNYPVADIFQTRKRLHFLGKGAWKVKNMKGAILTAKRAHAPIDIMGATRISFKMGFKFCLDPNAHFHGMVSNEEKGRIIPASRGLVFPVVWSEPFGLAITESMWYGAPLYGTPYGSLPELVGENGFLSNSASELAAAIREGAALNPAKCREYAGDIFNSMAMAKGYVEKYERVLNGESLNPISPQLTPQAASQKFIWND